MKRLKNMWYEIKDHLKDAKKQYEFAEEAHELGDNDLAKYHITNGLARIEMMKQSDKMFHQLAAKHMGAKSEDSLWKTMYKDTIEDAEYLEQCLLKMKQKI